MSAFLLAAALQLAAGPLPPEIQTQIQNALPAAAPVKPGKPRKVLIYTKAAGYVHSSIPFGAFALERLGSKTGAYQAEVSDDPGFLRMDKLKSYNGVILISTTQDFIPKEQAGDLVTFVENGGGLAGIHAATDALYGNPDYGKLIGGWFNGHPWHEKVTVRVEDPKNPVCLAFVERPNFEIVDEIYQFKDPYSRGNCRVLLGLDPLGTDMGKPGINRQDGDFPVAWIRTQGQGRVFYCSLGHREEIYWNPMILQFYLAGIQYSLGDLKADASPLPQPEAKDPWMGEYEGDGALAQVFPSGIGSYKVHIQPSGGTHALDLQGRPLAGGTFSISSGGGFEDAIPVWTVYGPFTFEDPVKGDNTPKGLGKAVESTPGLPGFIDLLKILGGENRHAYLETQVWSEKAQDAVLEIGSDDGVRAWLNRTQIHDNPVMRGFEPAQDRVAVRLQKGWNELRLRVDQGGGDWAAWARFRNPDGGPIPGLRAKAGKEVELTSASTPDWNGSIKDGVLEAKSQAETYTLKRSERKSPTLGQKPPPGAEVPAWTNANWLQLPDGSMEVRGGDNKTVKDYGDCRVHVEYRVPYMPGAAGQGRGNSGVYLEDRYEIQVLDSFGLIPGPGDCGAIYQIAVPPAGACLPPLAWQTFDIEFRAPRFDMAGRKTENGRITVSQNGIKIHDNVELPTTTGGAAPGEVPRAALRLQDHGNPVRYRNIWVQPL